jgi:hypothetical protein
LLKVPAADFDVNAFQSAVDATRRDEGESWASLAEKLSRKHGRLIRASKGYQNDQKRDQCLREPFCECRASMALRRPLYTGVLQSAALVVARLVVEILSPRRRGRVVAK